MQELSTDMSAFLRLDNAAVVDFLTSTASVLADQGLIGSKDTDNLRLALSGIQTNSTSRNRPLLLELREQNGEFLEILSTRYGIQGFCLNLLRYRLRSQLPETLAKISEWGQNIVRKAEMLFNRPFYIYVGSRCERRVLFSQALIDFAETLAHTASSILSVYKDLLSMNPHDLAASNDNDYATDHRIAQSLGFTSLLNTAVPGRGELAAKRQLANALLTLAEHAEQFASQLAANIGTSTYSLTIACDWLRSESYRLTHFELPIASDLMIWEARRRHFMTTLSGINAALALAAQASLHSIYSESHDKRRTFPESVKRRIAFDLMTNGVATNTAWDATDKLFLYIVDKKLAPKELLPAELPKIHPALLPRSLTLLITISTDTNLMSIATEEKDATLRRSQTLMESFVYFLKAIVPALALTLLVGSITGCGLKTQVKSEIPELRPDIPFRNEPAKNVDGTKREAETQNVYQSGPGKPKATLPIPPQN